jgi:PASTA domain
MTFDDHLRGELRRVTAAQPLDADAALDAVKAAPGPAVAWLEEARPSRPRRARTRRLIGLAAAIALVAGAIALPFALRKDGNDSKDATRHTPKSHHLQVDPKALAAVTSALDATTNVGSFRVAYTMTEHPPTSPATTGPCPTLNVAPLKAGGPVVEPVCGVSPPHNVTTTGWATVNVDPYALISVSHVSNFGDVTVRADSTSVWEQGGANYGLEVGSNTGPGQSLSGFASLVDGTLGQREGAGAMMGLASPYGYLHVVKDAIVGAETAGTGTVNGEPVTVYRVSVAPERLATVPGLSDEQRNTIEAAVAVLHEEGLSGNTTDVSVDSAGFVVRTVSTNTFADGGTVVGDNTLSAFGCAGAIQMPNRPVTPTTVPATCADGSAPPPLPTATPSTSPATVTVPNVMGLTANQASSALGDVHLVPVVKQVSGPQQPAGFVIAQDPRPGSNVEPGSPVTISVDTGTDAATAPPSP